MSQYIAKQSLTNALVTRRSPAGRQARGCYCSLKEGMVNKMLALEKQSVETYQSLLKECRRKYKSHSIEPHLERLIQDEKRHAVLVEELIKILKKST